MYFFFTQQKQQNLNQKRKKKEKKKPFNPRPVPPLAFNPLSILIRPMPLVAFTQTQHHWHLLPRRTTVIHYTIIIYFFVSLSCRGASKSYHCSTHIMTSPNCLPTSQEREKFFCIYLVIWCTFIHTKILLAR